MKANWLVGETFFSRTASGKYPKNDGLHPHLQWNIDMLLEAPFRGKQEHSLKSSNRGDSQAAFHLRSRYNPRLLTTTMLAFRYAQCAPIAPSEFIRLAVVKL